MLIIKEFSLTLRTLLPSSNILKDENLSNKNIYSVVLTYNKLPVNLPLMSHGPFVRRNVWLLFIYFSCLFAVITFVYRKFIWNFCPTLYLSLFTVMSQMYKVNTSIASKLVCWKFLGSIFWPLAVSGQSQSLQGQTPCLVFLSHTWT